MTPDCACGGSGGVVVFACSGAADVGELADRVARRATQNGGPKMACLAAVSARVGPIVDAAKTAGAVLAIDGCSVDCTRTTLEAAGVRGSLHVRLDEMGFEKGNTTVDEEAVEAALQKLKDLLPPGALS